MIVDEKFVDALAMRHPRVRVKIQPMIGAMEAWRIKNNLQHSRSGKSMNALRVDEVFSGMVEEPLADSGAMLCSVKKSTIERMGLNMDNTIPTEMRLRGASGSLVDIDGAIMAKIMVGEFTTRQIIT